MQSARSKAHLLTAVHHVLDDATREAQGKDDLLSYFPAFEIMMDDLRDYRFYAADMLHPSPVAVDFIWSRFTDAYLDASPVTAQLIQDLAALQRNLQHKPFDPSSPAHHAFLRQQLATMDRLQQAWPHLDFGEEQARVEAGLLR